MPSESCQSLCVSSNKEDLYCEKADILVMRPFPSILGIIAPAPIQNLSTPMPTYAQKSLPGAKPLSPDHFQDLPSRGQSCQKLKQSQLTFLTIQILCLDLLRHTTELRAFVVIVGDAINHSRMATTPEATTTGVTGAHDAKVGNVDISGEVLRDNVWQGHDEAGEQDEESHN